MTAYLARRVAFGLVTLWAVSVLTFAMFFALPRDAATAMCPKNCDSARLDRVRTDLGLNEAKPVQYVNYMKAIFVGRDLGDAQGGYCSTPCLGYSYVNNEPVTQILARVLPVTISVVIPAAGMWLIIGVWQGLLSARFRGTTLDRLIVGVSVASVSMQLYFVGGLLLMVFVYTFRLLPYPRYTPLFQDPLAWGEALVLPWCAMAFLFSATYARLSRALLLETLSEDFIRTAEAKGLRRSVVIRKHALRAAVAPLVTAAGLDIGTALGGTVITETTFGLRGLGRTVVDAVHQSDLPTIMASVLVAAIFIVAANICVDTLYALIDPRVRLK